MGCCFSKELSSNADEEKTGLLRKSVEENAPKKRLSSTFFSLFDALDSEVLLSERHGAGGGVAVDQQPGPRVSVLPRLREDLGTQHLWNWISSSGWHDSEGAQEQDGDPVCVSPCVDPGGEQAFSGDDGCPGLLPSGQGLQEGSCVKSQLHSSIWKNSRAEGRTTAEALVRSKNYKRALGISAREMKDEMPAWADHKPARASPEREFYSICVVDDDCLAAGDAPCVCVWETAAVPECRSAVGGTWSPDNPAPGPGELEASHQGLPPQGTLGPGEKKEVFSEEAESSSELLTACDPPCLANTGGMQSETLQAGAHTRFPKDSPERRVLCNADLLPESNIHTSSDSPKYVNALPKEREPSRQAGPMGKPCAYLTNSIPGVGRSGESGALPVSMDQHVSPEGRGGNGSTTPLQVPGQVHLDSSSTHGDPLPLSLESIHLSSERCRDPVSFQRKCLPAVNPPNRLTDALTPQPFPGPTVVKDQLHGCSLGTTCPHLVKNGRYTLQPKGSSSYQEETVNMFVGRADSKRPFQWNSSCQMALWADAGSRKTQAHLCDVTQDVREAEVERRRLQEVPPGGKSLNDCRCLKNNFSTVLFTCTEEESETDPSPKTGNETCVTGSGSGPQRLENAEHKPQGHRDTVGHNPEHASSNFQTGLDWEADTLKCRVVSRQEQLAPASSSTTRSPDFETDDIEQNDETHRAGDCRHGHLSLAPASSSLISEAQEAEGGASDCSSNGENPSGKQVSSKLAEEVSAAFGDDVLGVSVPVLTSQGERLCLETVGVGPRTPDYMGPHEASGHAHPLHPAVAAPTLSLGVGVMESSKVIFGEMELSRTASGCSFLPGDGSVPEDRRAVLCPVPQGLPVSPGPVGRAVPLPEGALSLSESLSERCLGCLPEQLSSQPLDELSHCAVGCLASQTFSERMAAGCGHQVGCPWTNVIGEDPAGSECTCGKVPQGDLQGWVSTSFWTENPLYLPLMTEDAILWTWQSRGGQLVSMFYPFLLPFPRC